MRRSQLEALYGGDKGIAALIIEKKEAAGKGFVRAHPECAKIKQHWCLESETVAEVEEESESRCLQAAGDLDEGGAAGQEGGKCNSLASSSACVACWH